MHVRFHIIIVAGYWTLCCCYIQKMYLVMELCTGGELTARLRQLGYFRESVSAHTSNHTHTIFYTGIHYAIEHELFKWNDKCVFCKLL